MKIDIGKGHVDKKIIQYIKDKPNIIVATLDREMKSKIQNPKMIIRADLHIHSHFLVLSCQPALMLFSERVWL